MDSVKNKDLKSFFGLFLVSIVFTYYTTEMISSLWYWALLWFFFNAKKEYNHIWIMFFLLLFSSPGYLFYDRGVFHLPAISVPGMDREIFYNEIFTIVAIIKTIINPLKQEVFYKKHLQFLIGFSVFLLFQGFLLGSSTLTVLKSIRYFIPILLLLYLPKLIPYNMLMRTIYLMFASVFILVAAQMFDLIAGNPFARVLGEYQFMFSGKEVEGDSSVFDVTAGVVRTLYGPFTLLISLMVGISFVLKKTPYFKNNYLIIIVMLSAFSIFMSATRGWIIGVAFIFLGFTMIGARKFSKLIFIAVASIIVALSIPKINMQIVQSVERTLTLESFVGGDLTAGGTLKRVTERGPRVMNKFYESPLLGFGFSTEYYDYSDGHVGNQSLLLNGGIIGFGIYLFFLLFLLNNLYRAYWNENNLPAFMLMMGLLSMIIIHSSSSMIFSYDLDTGTALSLGLFFFLMDYFIKFYKPVRVQKNLNTIHSIEKATLN